jgi:putative phosphoribosyl transferase
VFTDRVDAGRRLASRLEHLRGVDVVVLGLPRGGVPVAAEVAKALDAPLDVILVRKLGAPFQPELGLGAIGEDDTRVINTELMKLARVSERELAAVEERERSELERRARAYRGGRPRVALSGRTALVIDDGIATGSTAMVACHVAREHGADRVVLAVPVAPPDWTDRLSAAADELVCVETHRPFSAIGQWYRDFSQVSDREVIDCLDQAALRTHARSSADRQSDDRADAQAHAFDGDVAFSVDDTRLSGHLVVPPGARGMVAFAHGSGSSRHSPRNRYVAELLNEAAVGTFLFDLLTDDEEANRANVFDIDLLAARLSAATEALRSLRVTHGLRIGYFGASTGAAAALWAAGQPGNDVSAIVSRGGRPDLAGDRLSDVTAPTLLIVGGNDKAVLDLNRRAQARLQCHNRLAVIPGATHLFEEPGTLRQAAELARDWFVEHLSGA